MADDELSGSLRDYSSTNLAEVRDTDVDNFSRKRMRESDTITENIDNIRSNRSSGSRQDFSNRNSENNRRDPIDKISQQQYERNQSSKNDFVSCISKDGSEVFRRAKKRTPLIQKSLAIVLASLQGVQIVIELKNDNEVTGTVDETDSNMNLTLYNVREVII